MSDAPTKILVDDARKKSVGDEGESRPSPGVRVRFGPSATTPFFALGGFVIIDPVASSKKETTI